jgi:hypothetical protein
MFNSKTIDMKIEKFGELRLTFFGSFFQKEEKKKSNRHPQRKKRTVQPEDASAVKPRFEIVKL